jgi:hypothetical protein
VVDLSAADAPEELGSLQMPWLETADWEGRVNIIVRNNVAYISSSLGRIFLIDLHDRRRPKIIGGFTLGGPVSSLFISDYLLFAEVIKKGLVAIDLKNIQAPEILGTIPLPGRLHSFTAQGEMIWYVHDGSNGLWSLPQPRRLQSSAAGEQLVARLDHQPPPGAYRFWLTDAGKHLLVPGVSWSSPQLQARQ